MNRKGFTLVELMVVIVIIGVLAAVAIPKFAEATSKARVTEYAQNEGVTIDVTYEGAEYELYKKYNSIYGMQGATGDTLIARSILNELKNGPAKPKPKPNPAPTEGEKAVVDGTSAGLDAVPVFSSIPYDHIDDNLYLVYDNDDGMAILHAIEAIKQESGRDSYEIVDTISVGILIEMEW